MVILIHGVGIPDGGKPHLSAPSLEGSHSLRLVLKEVRCDPRSSPDAVTGRQPSRIQAAADRARMIASKSRSPTLSIST